ncbi:hypothetical protein HGRIS_000900 [Hohenbuehelia grisea]|uniref:Uncharacterized protein n=1 Tax=Hohenbuehelia grisea TaxID=104357 RepID=A0ABR3IQ40_9AGAR
MSKLLGKAGKNLFAQHLQQYTPTDPVYEFYTDSKGRQKRRKRDLPPGLSSRDAKILKKVKARAHRLDKGFSICGFKFGWTFLISIIPVVGDFADILMNYFFVVRKAKQADLPGWLVRQMLFNNTVSGACSFIPFAGDVFLAVWKANSRNAALLEEFLRIRGEEFNKLRAEGRDPDAEQKAAKKNKGKKKVKDVEQGKKSKSSKTPAAKEEIVPGVTKHDVAEVKPGAGLKKGEPVTGQVPQEVLAPAAASSTKPNGR